MQRLLRLLTLPLLVQSIAIGKSSSCSDKGLTWEPCHLDFPPELQQSILEPLDCATLDVPLDYTNPHSDCLQLQLIRINATIQPAENSVVFAPGGPGISGVEEVARYGPVYRDVLRGRHDIIGFDARGVGHTIPFSCSSTQPAPKRSVYINQTEIFPNIDSWGLLKNKAWDEGRVFAESCREEQEENGQFLSTAFVARDLLNIAEAINPDGLLRLWGRSYGTILGQTFAAMFPKRVERMLLDSVVLPNDYYSGQWLTSTRETDESLAHFFQECVEAGAEVCPLANYTGIDTSSGSLMQALNHALHELAAKNLTLGAAFSAPPWFQSGEGIPVLSQLKFVLLAQAYRPNQYPTLLAVVNMTLSGNHSQLFELFSANPPEPGAAWSQGVNAFHGVACLDSPYRASRVDDMYELVQAQLQGGGMFADAFSPQIWPCAQWQLEAAERYEGAFRDMQTRHAVMLVNSPFDPITPMSAAFEASKAFRGSRTLVHRGHGHGLCNHPSLCTLRAVGEYFASGALPAAGAQCMPGKNGWEMVTEGILNNGTVVVTEDVKNEAERRMLEGAYRLALTAGQS